MLNADPLCFKFHWQRLPLKRNLTIKSPLQFKSMQTPTCQSPTLQQIKETFWYNWGKPILFPDHLSYCRLSCALIKYVAEPVIYHHLHSLVRIVCPRDYIIRHGHYTSLRQLRHELLILIISGQRSSCVWQLLFVVDARFCVSNQR